MDESRSSANALMQYSFLHVFANDPTIDTAEFEFMKRLALKDGDIDDAERQLLAQILSRVSSNTVAPAVWDEIVRFKERHRIV
jgi:hypothetical protein